MQGPCALGLGMQPGRAVRAAEWPERQGGRNQPSRGPLRQPHLFLPCAPHPAAPAARRRLALFPQQSSATSAGQSQGAGSKAGSEGRAPDAVAGL